MEMKMTEEQRMLIDIACSIMVSINALAEDRILKLADMVKGSQDPLKREQYHVKRNYYRHMGKKVANLMYDAVRMHDLKLQMLLKKHNKDNVDDAINRVAEMLDFSEDYLREEALNLRSALRKQIKKSDPEDLTILGHMFEVVAISALCMQVYDYFTGPKSIPFLKYDISKNFLRCEGFWNLGLKMIRSIDVRSNTASDVRLCADDILVSDETTNALIAFRDKIMSILFVDKLIEAREGEDPHYRDFIDCLIKKTA